MQLADATIIKLCSGDKPLIEIFVSECTRINAAGDRVISYGVAPSGYDARISSHFKVFNRKPLEASGLTVLDPKRFNAAELVTEIETDVLILPPHTYALSETIERFNIPSDIGVLCMAKSTYARCGISVNTTPINPGFSGHVVLEFYNHLEVPVRIYANEGFAFFEFRWLNQACEKDYVAVGGNYNNQQSGIQVARV